MDGKILYLSEKNLIDNNLLTMTQVMGSIEKMIELMYQQDYVMGGMNQNSHGLRMYVEKGIQKNLYIAMPGHLGGLYNTTGIKFHGPNRYLPGKKNETNHLVLLYDGDAGEPKGIISANVLTTIRTAAVSAFATKHLAISEPQEIGIVSPGKINTEYVKWILENYSSIKRIKVKGRSEYGVEKFKNKFKGIQIDSYEDIEYVIRESDIISINPGFTFENVTDMPFVREKWIKEGALFICPSFIKFTDSFLQNKANLIVDNYQMYESYAQELGEPVYHKLSYLGNLLVDLVKKGKIDRKQIYNVADIAYGGKKINKQMATVFSSGGMSIEDIAVGNDVLNEAIQMGVGTYLEF